MKFNFRHLLAGLLIPTGITAVTFSSNNPLVNPVEVKTRPYIVETIAVDGSVLDYAGLSSSSDPFTISTELKANPYPEDKFSVFPDLRMGIGAKITIYRAPDYVVIDGKKKLIFRTWQTTVGGLLAEKEIDLGDDDKINFAASTELETGMEIRIIRVALTNLKQTQDIDFKVIKKDDKTLDKGKIKIEQKGVLGVRTLTYLVRREDGAEVSRTLTNNEITTPPVDEIQIIGTKPVITGWCKYNDMVLDASIKNGLDPDRLCALMKKESWGNYDSVNPNGYYGLFQYEKGFWASVSAKAGYAGADIFDAKAQIYTTAWAVTHGYAGRWPGTFK